MSFLKKLIVALDLSPMDAQVLGFLEPFTRAILPDEVTMLHVAPPIGLPDTVFDSPREKENYRLQRIAELKAVLDKQVEKAFGHRSDMKVSTLVLEGNPLTELLRIVAETGPHLLVVGKKEHTSGSGIISQKLARRVSCSILLVPEDAPQHIKRIAVPIDFSPHSKAAMQMAIEVAPLLGDPEVAAMHVFDLLPTVALKIGRTPEQLDRMVRANVEEAMDEFMDKIPHGKMDIQRKLLVNRFNSPARHILEFFEMNNTHLAIIGAKGHSLLESLFLGSVTERIIMSNQKVPLLVVRPQKTN